MGAYYNEIDPGAAEWLRELIKAGHIADGVVDERSIEDVIPAELCGFTQCHFFAGVGVWSYALRLAGWPDDRPVWTGSCPCQPFSAAGKGGGFDDERHVWPAWLWLIAQSGPGVVFGEQVASEDARTWLDLVSSDLEGEDFAIGAAATVACGFGAPHKRQRTYWVADSDSKGDRRRSNNGPSEKLGALQGATRERPPGLCATGELADPELSERRQEHQARGNDRGDGLSQRQEGTGGPQCDRTTGPLVNAQDNGHEREQADSAECSGDGSPNGSERAGVRGQPERPSGSGRTAPTNGAWRDADWLYCRDERWRPVEPGTFPLASGVAERVGLLRGYGNAIVAQQAQAFIEAYNSTKGPVT